MIKWIKKLFSKAPSNPYGIDERELRSMVNCNIPIGFIKAKFPNLPTEVLVKYIITGKL
ncbi:hypothetical protein [Paramuribaculum intestinale]|uniref:hypothetical protein n=1 Tax=Paramuribaculum intestinale TaxID=2094151 RepID=UPI0025A949F2|nr:hypothetical protein [Paramuribaculum intestinale]